MLHQLLFIALRVGRTKAIVISFGGYWSFFASLMGKFSKTPTYIILNGTDCVSFPEIGYGNLRSGQLKYVIKKSYQWASLLLPVSESLVRTANTYYAKKPIYLGYAIHLPGVRTPYKVIGNGLLFKDWFRDISVPRDKNTYITVLSPGQEVRKGIPLIIELANKRPDLSFLLGGISEVTVAPLPANVRCLGRLNVVELREEYNRSQFYLQLSCFEGFGVALCEAMLCECVPIGSAVNVIPEIIGDTGFILDHKALENLVPLIERASAHTNLASLGTSARQRIIANYDLGKRKKEFLNLLAHGNA